MKGYHAVEGNKYAFYWPVDPSKIWHRKPILLQQQERFTAHQHANHGLESKQGCTQANDVHSHACVQCAPDSLLLHLLALQIGALRDICVALDLSSEPSVAVRPECGEITQDYREQSRPQ
jgi:hypothetical protein